MIHFCFRTQGVVVIEKIIKINATMIAALREGVSGDVQGAMEEDLYYLGVWPQDYDVASYSAPMIRLSPWTIDALLNQLLPPYGERALISL